MTRAELRRQLALSRTVAALAVGFEPGTATATEPRSHRRLAAQTRGGHPWHLEVR